MLYESQTHTLNLWLYLTLLTEHSQNPQDQTAFLVYSKCQEKLFAAATTARRALSVLRDHITFGACVKVAHHIGSTASLGATERSIQYAKARRYREMQPNDSTERSFQVLLTEEVVFPRERRENLPVRSTSQF